MAPRLEKISDETVIKALTGHVGDNLTYELRELHKRVQASLRRMDKENAKYKGKYCTQ